MTGLSPVSGVGAWISGRRPRAGTARRSILQACRQALHSTARRSPSVEHSCRGSSVRIRWGAAAFARAPPPARLQREEWVFEFLLREPGAGSGADRRDPHYRHHQRQPTPTRHAMLTIGSPHRAEAAEVSPQSAPGDFQTHAAGTIYAFMRHSSKRWGSVSWTSKQSSSPKKSKLKFASA
jgi:hypothetical protein